MNTATREVGTIFRGAATGLVDGDFRTARFSNTMYDLAVGSDGSIYVLDCGNRAVRNTLFIS